MAWKRVDFLLNDDGKKTFGDFGESLFGPLKALVADSTPYTYKPLKEGIDAQIRVLILLSGSKEELVCQIQHVELSSAEFVALSYEWGASEKLFSIKVVDDFGEEQGVIPVTNNLHSALCNLRDSKAPQAQLRRLWIDQICINQNDISERSHQVNLMGQIYRNATLVLSYLGPQEPSDSEGLRLMKSIFARYNDLLSSPQTTLCHYQIRQRLGDPVNVPEHLRFDPREFPVSALATETLDGTRGEWTILLL